MNERHREVWLGRFAMHADATNRIQQITRDLLATWRRSPTRFAHRAPTTKLRKTDSRHLFLAAAGRQKAARRGAGLDRIGSSRHG
jgi:hypothetical protein